MTCRAPQHPLDPFDEPVLIATASPRSLGRGAKAVLGVAAVGALVAAVLAIAPLVGLVAPADGGAAANGVDAIDRRTSTAPPVTASTTLEPTTPRPPPPVIPGPVLELGSHPLLAPGLAPQPTECVLPRLGDSDEAIQAYHRAAVACLDAVWAPTLAARGLPHTPAKLDHAIDPGLTPCGRSTDITEDFTAWYCDLDDTIYLPMDRIREDAHPAGAVGHLSIVAHEYGHHVQGASGLLLASDVAWSDAPDEAAALLLNRRMELQANCFGSLSLAALAGRGSVSRRTAAIAADDYRWADDSDTHGTARSQRDWAQRGLDAGTTDACNTWITEPDAVR